MFRVVRFCNNGKADSWLINIQNVEACDRNPFILNGGDLFISYSTVLSLILTLVLSISQTINAV